MDLLCSDKTGTLTQNRLTLGEPFAVERRLTGGGHCSVRPWLRGPRTKTRSTWPS